MESKIILQLRGDSRSNEIFSWFCTRNKLVTINCSTSTICKDSSISRVTYWSSNLSAQHQQRKHFVSENCHKLLWPSKDSPGFFLTLAQRDLLMTPTIVYMSWWQKEMKKQIEIFHLLSNYIGPIFQFLRWFSIPTRHIRLNRGNQGRKSEQFR